MRFDAFLLKHKHALTASLFLALLIISFIYFTLKVYKAGLTTIPLILIGIFAVTLFGIFCLFTIKKKYTFELIASLVIFCLGIIYIFSWGPFKAADEPGHYLASYRYSNALIGIDTFRNNIPMREEDKEFFLFWENDSRVPQNDFSELREQLHIICTNPTLIQVDTGYSFSIYRRPPQMHIVPAVGLVLGRLLKLGAIPTYYLGRLLSLLVFSLCSFFVLRLLPTYKYAVLGLLLLPITLQLASSFSYDTPIIETSLLLFALCINAIHSKQELPVSQLIGIAILIALLVPMKTIYTLLSLFVLAIPERNFITKRQSHAYRAIIIAVIITLFTFINIHSITALTDNTTGTFNSSGNSTNPKFAPSYTLSMALENPAHAVWLLLTTAFENAGRHIQGLFGGLMSWTNIVSPWYIVFIFATTFFTAIFCEQKPTFIRPSMRLICVLAFLLGTIAIYISLMVGWISIKEKIIVGIQGRYFIPLLPLLITALAGLNNYPKQVSPFAFLGVLLYTNLYLCGWVLSYIQVT